MLSAPAPFIVYQLHQFQTIKDDGFECTISEDVMEKIRKIAAQVGSPNYIKTPVFHRKSKLGGGGVGTAAAGFTEKEGGEWKRIGGDAKGGHPSHEGGGGGAAATAAHRRRGGGGGKSRELSSMEWENMRNGEGIKIVEVPKHLRGVEGIEKEIRELRGFLNKLTDKTYDDTYSAIITKMDTLVDNEKVNDDDLTKVCESIFETASGNQFYSNLYAGLYHALMNRYRSLDRVFRENYNKFTLIFENIRTANPDTDYDLFCEINVENDNRRATAVFMTNLMNEGVITVEDMNKIIDCFFVKLGDFMKSAESKHMCDEIIETIGHVVKTGREVFSNDPDFISERGALSRLRAISKMNTSEHPGLSKRTLFKCMDIIDQFK